MDKLYLSGVVEAASLYSVKPSEKSLSDFLISYSFSSRFRLAQAVRLVADYSKINSLLDALNNECIILDDRLKKIFKFSVIYLHELKYIILSMLVLEEEPVVEAFVIYTKTSRMTAEVVDTKGYPLSSSKVKEVLASNKVIHLKSFDHETSFISQKCRDDAIPEYQFIEPSLQLMMPHALRDALKPYLPKHSLYQNFSDICAGVARYILFNRQRVENLQNPGLIDLQNTDLGDALWCNLVHRDQIQEVLLSCLLNSNKFLIKRYTRKVKMYFLEFSPEKNWQKYLIQRVDLSSLSIQKHLEDSAQQESNNLTQSHLMDVSASGVICRNDGRDEQLSAESALQNTVNNVKDMDYCAMDDVICAGAASAQPANLPANN